MRTTVPKNGKPDGKSSTKAKGQMNGFAGRAHAEAPAPALGDINHDADQARGFTLEEFLTLLQGDPKTIESRRNRIRDAIAFRSDECAALDVIHRWLVRNRSFLVAAFGDATTAEKFLLRDMLLASADHLRKVEPGKHPFTPEELGAVSDKAAHDLQTLAPLLQSGLDTQLRGPRGTLASLDEPIAQTITLVELMFAYLKDSFQGGTPEDWDARLAGLVPLVANTRRRLQAAYDEACATINPERAAR